jgi:mRNA-degrading endonuclease RelE of RelBE toxin-antitoxin system
LEVIFSRKAQKDLDSIDLSIKKIIFALIEKNAPNPLGMHMRHGLPFFVENATRQARIIYNQEDKNLLILRCFQTRKQYEKGYKSFR